MVDEKWILRNRKFDYEEISNKYNISLLKCKVMANRGIDNENLIKNYIYPDLNNLYNPKSLKDIDKAVEILNEKIISKKKIKIVGDYDVDGVISVYILYTALKKLNANVSYEIPDRIKDGYGINKNIIKSCYDEGVDTIITCDNGISAISEIDYAKSLGLTVIVTDHHDVSFDYENDQKIYKKPNADAIINQKQNDCTYEFKFLCGAGICYKLVESLFLKFNLSKEDAYEFIEFASIATVCDVVDLIDENRIIVKNGLKMINKTKNIGLRELIKANNLENKEITAYHLGYVIGPCINASGRLDSAKKGLELLLCKDVDYAKSLAFEIVSLNEERKEMTSFGVDRAIKIIESTNLINDDVLVVYIQDIHESLAGIIAGRIKEKYNKPTIIITNSEENVKGSARSIEEYNIFEELLACSEILERFGGHPMAAGLSLKAENIDVLRKMLNNNSKLTKEDLTRKVYIDSALNLEQINFELVEELKTLEPFGKGNSKPNFGTKNVNIVGAKIFGKDNNVLKLKLKDSKNRIIEGILFNNQILEFEEKFIKKYSQEDLDKLYNSNYNSYFMDFVFYPSINEYNSNKYIQINIESIR